MGWSSGWKQETGTTVVIKMGKCKFTHVTIAALLIYSCIITWRYVHKTRYDPVYKIKHCNSSTADPFPKIIHQIWDYGPVPRRWVVTSNNCKKVYSDYTFKLWTFEDLEQFMQENYPWFLPFFYGYPYDMQRIDVAKIFLLYHFGGIYLDMDVSCHVNLQNYMDKLLSKNSMIEVIFHKVSPCGLGNAVFVAKRKSMFLESVVYNFIDAQHSYIFNYITLMFTTGSCFLSRIYDNFNCKESVELTPVNYFYILYFTHHYNSGWLEWDGKLIAYVDDHRWTSAGVGTLCIIAGFLLVKYRYHFIYICKLLIFIPVLFVASICKSRQKVSVI